MKCVACFWAPPFLIGNNVPPKLLFSLKVLILVSRIFHFPNWLCSALVCISLGLYGVHSATLSFADLRMFWLLCRLASFNMSALLLGFKRAPGSLSFLVFCSPWQLLFHHPAHASFPWSPLFCCWAPHTELLDFSHGFDTNIIQVLFSSAYWGSLCYHWHPAGSQSLLWYSKGGHFLSHYGKWRHSHE